MKWKKSDFRDYVIIALVWLAVILMVGGLIWKIFILKTLF